MASGGAGTEQAAASLALSRTETRLWSDKPRSLWRDALRRLARNKAALAGLIVIITVIVLAILAPVIAPYPPNRQDLLATFESPSSAHLLGTDALGRDVLSRTLYGARVSMSVAMITVLIVTLIGLPLGLVAGFFGGAWDFILMRIVDAMYAFPDILFIIIISTYLNAALPKARSGPLLILKDINGLSGGLAGVFLALSLFGWLSLCRLVRGTVLSLRNQDYIIAARAVGASHRRIIVAHILPNALAPITIMLALLIPAFIIAEAGLSFIGLGVQPPRASWGIMISEGVSAIRAHPHLTLAPCIALSLTLLAFNFLGDGLRDALDPSMH
jgi:ABC-type dipeptide/oligopeptide/nickel transport system permease subunit